MDNQLLSDIAQRIKVLAEQIANSAHALTSEDPDIIATIGAQKKTGRLNTAIKDFGDLLPEFMTRCAAVSEPEMAQTSAAALLTKAALGIVQQDSNALQIMGRGYLGREQERLDRELASEPHLQAALATL